MKLLPVSALSSWTFCPRQFYLAYVLKKAEPPKDVMILGLIKHKLHERIHEDEQALVETFDHTSEPQPIFEQHFTEILRDIVRRHRRALATVNVEPHDAFQQSLPIARFEAASKTKRVTPHLRQGIVGADLWHALTPKIKPEYTVQSKTLGIRGRIDQLECYPSKLVPVELKSGKAPQSGVWDGHRVQAASYAIMLEELFGTAVAESVVHYIDQDDRRVITINPFLRDEIAKLAHTVHDCFSSQTLPEGCGRENCSACAYFASNQ